MAGDHPEVVMGPMRITVVVGEGRSKAADLWAMNRLDDPIVNGIVCLLTPETTAVGLAEAVTAIANDAELPTVAARVVRAMQGHPTTAEAVLLSAGPSGFRAVAESRPDLPDLVPGGPWDLAQSSMVRQVARDRRRTRRRRSRRSPVTAATRRCGSNRSARSAARRVACSCCGVIIRVAPPRTSSTPCIRRRPSSPLRGSGTSRRRDRDSSRRCSPAHLQNDPAHFQNDGGGFAT